MVVAAIRVCRPISAVSVKIVYEFHREFSTTFKSIFAVLRKFSVGNLFLFLHAPVSFVNTVAKKDTTQWSNHKQSIVVTNTVH